MQGSRKGNNGVNGHTNPKEGHGAAAFQGPVGDLVLFGQVLGTLDGRDHAFHRQERGQIRRVRGDYYQREEPPYTAHNSRRSCLRKSTFEYKSSLKCTTEFIRVIC